MVWNVSRILIALVSLACAIHGLRMQRSAQQLQRGASRQLNILANLFFSFDPAAASFTPQSIGQERGLCNSPQLSTIANSHCAVMDSRNMFYHRSPAVNSRDGSSGGRDVAMSDGSVVNDESDIDDDEDFDLEEFLSKDFEVTYDNADVYDEQAVAEAEMAKLVAMNQLLEYVYNVQDARNWKKVLKLKRLRFSEIADSVYAAASPKHGLGVFAKHDLEKHVIATMHPIQALGWVERDGPRWISDPLADLEAPKGPDQANRSDRSDYVLEVGQASVKEIGGAAIDINLPPTDIEGWLGHRANDGAICSGTSEKEILQYFETCKRECNCVMIPFGNAAPFMCLFTKRAIKKGEELCWGYGFEYWVDHFGGSVTPEMNSDVVMEESLNLVGDFEGGWYDDSYVSKLELAYAEEIDYFEEILRRHFDSPEQWRHLLRRRLKAPKADGLQPE